MIPNIIFIILIGLLTSYTDLKRRVIENRVILVALIAAPVLHAFQLIQNPALFSAVPLMFYSMIFSVFAGFLLWYIYIWPAGDAKLFIAYSFLLPLDIYQATTSFISFDFLINTFVPVFFVMFLVLLTKSKKSEIKKSLKLAFNTYTIFLATIFILGFLWLIFEVLGGFGISQNYLIAMVLLFIMIEIVTKVSPINLEYLYIAVAVIRIIVDYRTVFTLNYVYYLVSLLFIFLILRYFVIDLGFKRYTVKKRIEELKPGMCPAEGIKKIKHGKTVKYEKEKLTQFTIIQALKDRSSKKFIHNLSFEGLTREEVGRIKRLKKEGKLEFDHILVHTITPFALFLFLGILMTVFLKTNFVIYLSNLLLG
ncbi:MAG: hypothetical protein JSV39_03255 [Candidatus Aenigmatarchaeota archaeon]|nr:MAG: hypothetical protein JSV39_03255 [Candidatus Aenigmarchaeota archaeon]